MSEAVATMSFEDAFLAALTDGMVHNGLLLGETWEALCSRKYKPPPTGTAVLVTSRSRDLTDAEVQIAAKLYQDSVQSQPDVDLDDIMQQVLDQREINHMKWDFERAQKIAAHLPRLQRQVTVLTKTKAGSVKELSPMQFAAHFGEVHVVLALLAASSVDDEAAFFEACREGYVPVVNALLSASNATWSEDCVGHGFVLATRRNHLLVLQALVVSPFLRLDVLCHGPWFQDQALGQRYITLAVEIAFELSHGATLQWLLDRRLLTAAEWTRQLDVGLRLASTTEGNAQVYLPLLHVLLTNEPSLAIVLQQLPLGQRPIENTTRFKAIQSTLLFDYYGATASSP